MTYERSIEFVVETLKNAKGRNKKCSLLIGAGCSVTAGIPLASEFVKIIKDKYPRRYERASSKTYPECMAELLDGERRDLLAEYIDKAYINWSHVCIALLIKCGYVDRVLTVNFDPLVIRACALLGVFPAVYDIAASEHFKAADITDDAVFYLHGQRTGFVLLNTKEEVQAHSDRVGPIFDDSSRNRVWVVVGYSGENDPVFDHLAKIRQFDNGLFWIGHGDHEPPKHVTQKMLGKERNAFFTRGFDADSFFVSVSQHLEIFPPDILARPFSHLDTMLATLTPFSLADNKAVEDVTALPRHFIRRAIQEYEPGVQAALSRGEFNSAQAAAFVQKLVMAGDYVGAIAFHNVYDRQPSPELAQPLAWAYMMQGRALAKKADKIRSNAEAVKLYAASHQHLVTALAIQPDRQEAIQYAGTNLSKWADRVSGDERERLLQQSVKYYETLTLRPEDADTDLYLRNYGIVLYKVSQLKKPDDASHLRKKARELFQRADDLKPGYAAYGLACLSALEGGLSECQSWLELSLESGQLPDLEFLQGDADLDSVRDTQWFKDFLAKVSAQSPRSARVKGK